MVVFLDGKGAKAALPDMAAGVIVLVVATDVGGQQPHHVVAQVAILRGQRARWKWLGIRQ